MVMDIEEFLRRHGAERDHLADATSSSDLYTANMALNLPDGSRSSFASSVKRKRLAYSNIGGLFTIQAILLWPF